MKYVGGLSSIGVCLAREVIRNAFSAWRITPPLEWVNGLSRPLSRQSKTKTLAV